MTGPLVIYLLFMNAIGFVLMGLDKRRAQNHQWRVSERALFAVAILGGSVGSIAGMWTFRHKTKHWYFVIGFPLILVVQVVAICYLSAHFFLS